MKKPTKKKGILLMFMAPEILLIIAMVVSGLIYLFLN